MLLWRKGQRRPYRTSYLAIIALARDLPGGYEPMTGGNDDAGLEDGERAGHDQ